MCCHVVAAVAAAGGRVIVVTWCHRVLQPGEASLNPNERMLLDKICDAYYLPAWCSVADYQRLFGECGVGVAACLVLALFGVTCQPAIGGLATIFIA
jgi:hypothetical protein